MFLMSLLDEVGTSLNPDICQTPEVSKPQFRRNIFGFWQLRSKTGCGESEHCTAEIHRSRRPRRQIALGRPKPGGDRHQEFQKYTFQTEQSRTAQVD